MSTIVYKVLLESDAKKLYSAYICGDASKQYKLGIKNHAPKWLKKMGYWLLAFEYLQNAKQYKNAIDAMDPGSVCIYKAEANSIKRDNLPLRYDSCYVNRITEFKDYMLATWPRGTVMVDGLKLIERIE
jgi:hypothetical protein